MSIRIIDTHSHLHFSAYPDKERILQNMKELNCATIAIGTNGATSESAIQFARESDLVFASVGFHPTFFTSEFIAEEELSDPEPYSKERLLSLAKSSDKVVALGETGLDYYRLSADHRSISELKELQKKPFLDHLDAGQELGLPIVIHCREAFDDLLKILKDRKERGIVDRCVIHCFTGDWKLAEALLDVGCFLSFTGIITFPNKKQDDPESLVQRVIERMPLDRLMIETDAPWLAPVPHRGERNDPTMVTFVAEKIAEIRKVSVEEIFEKTTENAIRFFQLP